MKPLLYTSPSGTQLTLTWDGDQYIHDGVVGIYAWQWEPDDGPDLYSARVWGDGDPYDGDGASYEEAITDAPRRFARETEQRRYVRRLLGHE